ISRPPPRPTLFPYTTLFRSLAQGDRLSTGRVGEQVRSVDPARRLFVVEADETIAEGPQARAAIAAGFDFGALANAAQLLGAGKALLDASTEYVKQRKQFGRPIDRKSTRLNSSHVKNSYAV